MSNNQLIGIVTSIISDKSIIVSVLTKYKHLKYLKIISKHKKLAVHDTNNISKKGNIVLIKKTKPISAKKNWILEKIITY